MTTPRESEIPEWLPVEMRHTATPSERLRSLLRSLPRLLENQDSLLLQLRAWKAQHLCLQINADACAGPAPTPLGPDEARLTIEIAVGLLGDPEIEQQNRNSLIYIVHQSAMSLAAAGRKAAAPPTRPEGGSAASPAGRK